VRELSRVSIDPQSAVFPEVKQLLKSRNQTSHKNKPPPAKNPADSNPPKEASKPAEEELSRHFISSLDVGAASAQRMAQTIQAHWCCESRHWQRDACWREDQCLIRNRNAACALALIRASLQSLVCWSGRHSLPAVFEDVAHDLSLGLGWLTSRHLRT
jgi:hypothetical protein